MSQSSPRSSSTALQPLSRWPAVSVVIPAKDCAATLEAAVRSALQQRFDGSIEVVIAVAPSSDATERIAAATSHAHPRVRWRVNAAGSTPAGLNVAIRAARGDVIVRLDAHAELPSGYIARALDVLRETGAANVGGMQVPVGATVVERAIAAAMRSPLGSGGARYRIGGVAGEVETVYLGVFRREALEEVGGFDERLVRNQDYELNHRLREAGLRVWFDPGLGVRYRPRGTLIGLARQYAGYGAWKRHVLRLHPRSARLRQLLPPFFVLALVAGTLGAVFGRPWPLAALVGAYVLVLVAAAAAHLRDGIAVALLVPVVLAIMHLAWGAGFLVGRR